MIRKLLFPALVLILSAGLLAQSALSPEALLKRGLQLEQVDGDFALMRSGRIEFSVEKSTKGLLGTVASGEGLLQTFRGTGRVWIAPTQPLYDGMHSAMSTVTVAK